MRIHAPHHGKSPEPHIPKKLKADVKAMKPIALRVILNGTKLHPTSHKWKKGGLRNKEVKLTEAVAQRKISGFRKKHKKH